MQRIRCLQIDAFTDQPFRGNPAAVCLLDAEADAEWMQNVALEMNLAETAFVRSLDEDFELRWFTPAVEADLCGHATLATAHAMWSEGIVPEGSAIRFNTRSGTLTCERDDNLITLDFPALPAVSTEPPSELIESLAVNPTFVGLSKLDYLIEVATTEEVLALQPDFVKLHKAGARGVMVTAAASSADDYDFMSRFFAPAAGIDEDPVTGSAHCVLAPFWAERMGRQQLTGYQASQRGGIVRMTLKGDRVVLGGQAVTVMEGFLVT